MKIYYYDIIAFMMMALLATAVDAAGPSTPQWWLLDDSLSFIGDNENTIKASVVTVVQKDVKIRIVSVPFEVKKTPGYSESDEVSLRSFAKTILTHPQYRSKGWIVVNGGFSSYRVDVPLGLLIVDGNVYSITENESQGKKRWNGIICQRKDNNNWDIITMSSYTPGFCQQALQAGPLIVQPDNKIGIDPDETKIKDPYSRTIMCLMKDSRMKFVIISEKTYLFPLAKWLSKAESSGGLGCRVAINLSGDSSSGIAIRSPGKGIKYIGDGSFPLPSALIIEKNSK